MLSRMCEPGLRRGEVNNGAIYYGDQCKKEGAFFEINKAESISKQRELQSPTLISWNYVDRLLKLYLHTSLPMGND